MGKDIRPIGKKRYYVTMTDTFFSNLFGQRTSKLIIGCDTFNEAETVEQNARNRSDQKYINIRSSKPYYPASYEVVYHDKTDYPSWFERNYF